MKLLTELIQDFAYRIRIGGNVQLRLLDDRGQWFSVDISASTFNAVDETDDVGKMVAVLPIKFEPSDDLSDHKEAGQ